MTYLQLNSIAQYPHSIVLYNLKMYVSIPNIYYSLITYHTLSHSNSFVSMFAHVPAQISTILDFRIIFFSSMTMSDNTRS